MKIGISTNLILGLKALLFLNTGKKHFGTLQRHFTNYWTTIMKKTDRISSGIRGLDEILCGGFIPQRSYLVKGGPGTGKSTFGYHFLENADQNDGKALYITLGESKENILSNASQLGIDLSDVIFLDLSPKEDLNGNLKSYSLFTTAEVEQGPIIESIVDAVEKHEPTCVFLDSITMLQSINENKFQIRKVILSFIKFICNRGATLLISSEAYGRAEDKDATFWVDGIIHLEYSSEWRRMNISKFRGSNFRGGDHAFKIGDEGVKVFPRMQPNIYERSYSSEPISTGVDELDKLLHGGIEKGTVTILAGPTGVGKTNFGLQFAKEAASRGERSMVYTFEESADVLIKRSELISVPIREMIESKNLEIVPIEPLSYSPDEFASIVHEDVTENDTKIVIIDSVGGYNISVREEDALERLHTLGVYLQNMGVTTLMINETPNVIGQFQTTGMNASYLADNIIFLRYLELNGELKKAIGVLKKRLSDFERTIREFEITSDGLKVGAKLTNLKGILTGQPEITE